MCPLLGRGFLHEEAAALHATVPAIDLAKITKRLPASNNLNGRGNGDGDLDNRFGVESGHRGAPEVLDIQYLASNVLLKHASFLLERGAPAGLVRND